MKTVIKVLVGFFLGLGLVQLVDLGMYLMNRPDSYLFNLGVLVLLIVFVAFGFLGLYMLKVIKPEEEVKQVTSIDKSEAGIPRGKVTMLVGKNKKEVKQEKAQ